MVDSSLVIFNCFYGEMAEWSKASALKADIPQGIVGSNPTLSEKFLILHFSLLFRRDAGVAERNRLLSG